MCGGLYNNCSNDYKCDCPFALAVNFVIQEFFNVSPQTDGKEEIPVYSFD